MEDHSALDVCLRMQTEGQLGQREREQHTGRRREGRVRRKSGWDRRLQEEGRGQTDFGKREGKGRGR